ncbi:MAG: sugar transferase [Bacteroidetes bacterium]|nr:MAG: sugar transferase [Bacteroidota bacterium]REK07230.1 MAG: sugar transferase [Bacteroidota bacterium]REK31783.1 MAG: sugar transferase [Bacteroidota bacterium]REK48037.1 MAG: sugar transferase [Bacteroidota bacterium]
MKKGSSKTSNGSKWLERFRPNGLYRNATSLAMTAPELRRSKKRRFQPKPHLEKIGGMDKQVRSFISAHCELASPETSILRTAIAESILHLSKNFNTIINLKRINDVKEINRFLHAVNQHLPENGKFIGCVETKYLRKRRIMRKFPPVINQLYYLLDFILKRVFPKLPVTRFIYLKLTGDRNKVLSRTETFGRLYAAGFEICEREFIGNNLYFIAKKVKEPLFNYEPVYGPIFRMRRHGKDGRIIHVYKMRTMHAYSEFIQQYVYECNNLAEGGKLKDDFRVSTLGRFFRKYWIDELPMIINFFRGDLKLIGVRPLSSHYLSLYSPELREKRLKHKPGLIPPFYADMPKTLEEIMESELRYLDAYEKTGFRADVKYFFRALYNIVVRKARSK